LGGDVVVDFGADVVVLIGADVVVLFGTVVVDLGTVVLVVSIGAVVLVVSIFVGVVVVLVAEGTTIVVELAGDGFVDGSLITEPEVPDALEPPDELAVPGVEVMEVVVEIEVPEVPLNPLVGVPGFPLVDCDVESGVPPGGTDNVWFAETVTAGTAGGWFVT
jgi:hypothetical protein